MYHVPVAWRLRRWRSSQRRKAWWGRRPRQAKDRHPARDRICGSARAEQPTVQQIKNMCVGRGALKRNMPHTQTHNKNKNTTTQHTTRQEHHHERPHEEPHTHTSQRSKVARRRQQIKKTVCGSWGPVSWGDMCAEFSSNLRQAKGLHLARDRICASAPAEQPTVQQIKQCVWVVGPCLQKHTTHTNTQQEQKHHHTTHHTTRTPRTTTRRTTHPHFTTIEGGAATATDSKTLCVGRGALYLKGNVFADFSSNL